MRAVCVIVLWCASAGLLISEPVTVRHPQGLLRGFLTLSDLQGHVIAAGDLAQRLIGSEVRAELSLHFKDGSLHQETAVYSQRHTFQLLSYHEVQRGKSFGQAIDLSIDVAKRAVRVETTDASGKKKTYAETMDLPADLANGILNTVVLDLDPAAEKTMLSMVVATPKPRLVKLAVTRGADDEFTIAGYKWKAISYTVRFELGGLVGLIAPLVGKQPPDLHIWIVPGEAPGFLKLEGPLYEGGPIWRVQLAAPVWR